VGGEEGRRSGHKTEGGKRSRHVDWLKPYRTATGAALLGGPGIRKAKRERRRQGLWLFGLGAVKDCSAKKGERKFA